MLLFLMIDCGMKKWTPTVLIWQKATHIESNTNKSRPAAVKCFQSHRFYTVSLDREKKTLLTCSSVLARPEHFSSSGLRWKNTTQMKEIKSFWFGISHSKHLREMLKQTNGREQGAVLKYLLHRNIIHLTFRIKTKRFKTGRPARSCNTELSRIHVSDMAAWIADSVLMASWWRPDGVWPPRLTAALITLMQVAAIASRGW